MSNAKTNDTTIWTAIATERRRLADELDTLTDEQWEVETGCAGWNVHDVAAHLLVPFTISTPRFGLAMMRRFGNFDRAMIDLTAKVKAATPRAEISAGLRANAESRWTPPGEGAATPLGEIVVHGQDVRRALGLGHDIPQATIDLTINGMKDAAIRENYASRIG